MAFLRAFGKYLPQRVVTNAEMATLCGCEPGWILQMSGIEERRFANGETVADMGAAAAEDCLQRAGVAASALGMIIAASGSCERRFPGPAASVARRLGLDATPAIDLPIASAGSLFGLALASRLCGQVGPVLVIGSERMSAAVMHDPIDRNTAILFGDGAGACLVDPSGGRARVVDSGIFTDGAFTEDLQLPLAGPLTMNGRSVIMQASRKVPRGISQVLARNGVQAADVDVFLMHQANLNLIVKVAQTLGVDPSRFFSNIARYGNTSSASLLIAAADWQQQDGFRPGRFGVMAAFGAGFHWGALLAVGV